MPDPKSLHSNISIGSANPEHRTEAEERWVSYQPYLMSRGYQLRPRYRPDWVPSWKTSGKSPQECEDRGDTLAIETLDATRIEDGRPVMIKLSVPSTDEHDRVGVEEVAILERFSSEPLKDDPHNHVVPCLETLPIPNIPNGTFIITPLLSKYNHPEFWNLEEVHDFIEQLFEGLEFLHKHDVVHCDIASPTVQMDGQLLYSEPFHPFFQSRALDGKRPIYPKYLRSQRPVRYYFIDFGYARWFKDEQTPRTVSGSRAREITPEQEHGEPYDPFKADVYQLGAIIRRDLIPRISALDFLLPLARHMTDPDPSRRPTLGKARQSMNTQFAGLEGWRTRWPIIPLNVSFGHRCVFIFAGVAAEVMVFLRKLVRLVLSRH